MCKWDIFATLIVCVLVFIALNVLFSVGTVISGILTVFAGIMCFFMTPIHVDHASEAETQDHQDKN